MPHVDLVSFFRSHSSRALPALTGCAGAVALLVGLATLGGYISPRGAMFSSALLCALPAAWYARGFLADDAQSRVPLLLSSPGWALAALSFLMRTVSPDSRAAAFCTLGATLLVLAGVALFLSSLLVGDKTSGEDASTRTAKPKPVSTKKDLGNALRDARDL